MVPPVRSAVIASDVPDSMLQFMHRWARALPSALALLALTAALVVAAALAPDIDDQSVYDTAGMLDDAEIEQIEALIDQMEAEVGAEMVAYTQDAPDISEAQNLENARALVDQWHRPLGLRRWRGADDRARPRSGGEPGQPVRRVGIHQLVCGESDLQAIIDDTFVPLAVAGHRDRAIVETVEEVTSRASPEVGHNSKRRAASTPRSGSSAPRWR